MEKEEIVLCTGKKIKANLGLLSIGQDKNGRWFITEGYDSVIFDTEIGAGNDLSDRELAEIANIMIDRWKLFKTNVFLNTVRKGIYITNK